ncbi:conserved hypothetical protein [Culex quinquefasciatus]|uniref:Uncharacterized protein n=1 Tax=Culex quinquefasciatus TaxID=7176 RepID=B0XJT2_CULQU|nr:conserved hypothetical protein [Culex quinquefasciatus]|eukprot:XP_001869904.1 conserved hypothetical protein [Culex quinquefasciatus]
MKVDRCFFVVLLGIQLIRAFNPDAPGYVLRAIEYLTAVHGGVFCAVFYDVAPQYPRENVFNEVLKSPRLDHVMKYVLDGTEHEKIYELPRKPSLLINIVVQGVKPQLHETVPGIAVYWDSGFADVFKEVAFDYERMQPFYVVLNYEHFSGYEMYSTSYRNSLISAFRFVHITLVEAGLLDLWKRQWRDTLRSKYIGRRPRVDISEKADLNFDDMQPAWMALGVGLLASFVGFLGELNPSSQNV